MQGICGWNYSLWSLNEIQYRQTDRYAWLFHGFFQSWFLQSNAGYCLNHPLFVSHFFLACYQYWASTQILFGSWARYERFREENVWTHREYWAADRSGYQHQTLSISLRFLTLTRFDTSQAWKQSLDKISSANPVTRQVWCHRCKKYFKGPFYHFCDVEKHVLCKKHFYQVLNNN